MTSTSTSTSTATSTATATQTLTPTATATALPDANLKLDKDTQFPLPPVGSEYDYTFTVSNTGPGTAVGLMVVDILSPLTSFVSASAPALCSDLGSGVVNCSLPDVPNGGDVSFTIRVLLDPNAGPGQSVFNSAVTYSDNNDPDQSTNFDFVQRYTLDPNNPLALAGAAAFAAADGQTGGGMVAVLTERHEADLRWSDATRVEDAYVVEARGGDGPWVPVAIVPSAATAAVGAEVAWRSKPLPPGIPYAFRVYARQGQRGPWIALAQADEALMAPALMAAETGCVDGQLLLEGRARHGGAVVLVDGLPVGATDRRGAYHVCGVRVGARTVGAWQPGYLPSEQTATVTAASSIELADASLVGGDINRDRKVDVVDLVLAGAAAGWDGRAFRLDRDGDGVVEIADVQALAEELAANPDRLWADVNGDAMINRTDLVLVGANLDRAGPTAAAAAAGAVAPAMLELMLSGAANDLRWHRDPLDLAAPDERFSLAATQQDDGVIAIDIVAAGVRDLYGADVILDFDPTKVRVLDAQPMVPGAQAEIGEAWGAGAFQAVNDAVRARSEWRAVLTRVQPDAPLAGEAIVLATLKVVPLDPEARPAELAGSWRLKSARLLDHRAHDLGVRIFGSTIRVPGRDGRTIWLPYVVSKEGVAGR